MQKNYSGGVTPDAVKKGLEKNFQDYIQKASGYDENSRSKTIQFHMSMIREARIANDQIYRGEREADETAYLCIAKSYINSKQSNQSSEPNTTYNQSQNSSSNNAPATNPLQSETQQSQKLARNNQARADQDAQRKGKRSHDPAAEAHHCIEIDRSGSGNFGAFRNLCSYPISFLTCNYKPLRVQGGFNWSADFDCSQNSFGLHTPSANARVAAHNRNTETVYWFACKTPAGPSDVTFVEGQGMSGRCR